MALRPGGADSIGPTALYKNVVRNTVKWVLAAAFILYATKYAYGMFVILSHRDIWENDFFAIWSFAKFTMAHSAGQIYDDATLHDFQMDLGRSPTYYLPYAHPPSFLLFIIPIGFLSYYAAFGGWIIGTFLFYFFVSTYKQVSRAAVFLTMFAPATVITFAAGQTGFLSSAFILGGFRLVTSHPVLSGIMFGLASIKPQLGLLIPIALVSAGQWRTVMASVATVLVLVFVSSLAFGWAIWPLWLSKLVAHANWAAEVDRRSSATIVGNLTLLWREFVGSEDHPGAYRCSCCHPYNSLFPPRRDDVGERQLSWSGRFSQRPTPLSTTCLWSPTPRWQLSTDNIGQAAP